MTDTVTASKPSKVKADVDERKKKSVKERKQVIESMDGMILCILFFPFFETFFHFRFDS